MTDSPIIVAALCWYDEPVHSLNRCIDSLAGFADKLVSMDGPYAHYPSVAKVSHPWQRMALAEAAQVNDIEHAVAKMPDGATQAGKRTALYRHAASLAGRSGWVLIIDADEELTGDYLAAIDELARIGAGFDAATVTSVTSGAASAQPRLLRAMDAITCGPEYHGMLSASDPNGTRVRIRDRREILEREHPRPRRAREIDLGKMLTITNHTNDRPDERKKAKREYVRRRTLDGVDL